LKIYHIIPRFQWEEAQRELSYRGDTLESEGFIHFSKREQVLFVANARFKGHTGLLLLEVDSDKLRAELKHEPPYEGDQSGETFPHLYGELNLDAVAAVHNFEPSEDGTFAYPATM